MNLPNKGDMFVTANKLRSTDGMTIVPEVLARRRAGVVGRFHDIVPGHGGDVWWIEHAGGFAPYCYTELDRFNEPHPLSAWHEDDGPALWWRFPVDEPPYVGTPLDTDWPGYHTHWTRIVVPTARSTEGAPSP